jgi:seryl-tRNA synthetase
VAGSPLCLTGTAEVPLGGVYMDKVLLEKELPIKMVAYGHCFRTEAGAAGMAGEEGGSGGKSGVCVCWGAGG